MSSLSPANLCPAITGGARAYGKTRYGSVLERASSFQECVGYDNGTGGARGCGEGQKLAITLWA